mmetsp:Transcript_47582/g.149069  ORF Transcript_47582/g.149069 Transcript_47582/m.149069 type:complete len:624 (-) Transcript_47582:578-2449(-)
MSKLDRWLNRSKESQAVSSEQAPVDVRGKGHQGINGVPREEQVKEDKLSRWVARSAKEGEREQHAGGAVAGGVSACCNLIRILDASELKIVYNTLVETMQGKQISIPALSDASQSLPPLVSVEEIKSLMGKEQKAFQRPKVEFAKVDMMKKCLEELLDGLASIANESAARARAEIEKVQEMQTKHAEAQQKHPKQQDATADNQPKSKLDRWVKKVQDGNSTSNGADDTKASKLDRWLKRSQGEQNEGAQEEGKAVKEEKVEREQLPQMTVQEALKGEDAQQFAQRCFNTVKEAWSLHDKILPAAVTSMVSSERDKIEEERTALDKLMQMVYALKETPDHVSSLSPPSSPSSSSQQNFSKPSALFPSSSPQREDSMDLTPSELRAKRVDKNDPDKLLQEFLAARREERVQETQQFVAEKKNPKVEKGGGWRAGSPMANAAKPTIPIKISLTRPPPPPPPPVMMGPPPEGLPEGVSREEVMNKEGGGFFFYPPGHPNYVPGGPCSANIQLEGQLRSTVHPQERIAPHWSVAKFQAQGMPEVVCEARHATFGPLKEVTGRLVRSNPPLANKELQNEHQVRGNVVYIKRGGCSFTKKARMAQRAGAVAMVVANSDRETFGMRSGYPS